MAILPKEKLKTNSKEIVDIISLRTEPEKIKELVDNKNYFEGYHMNKRHWFTICLDNTIPTETIYNYIDNSYNLAKK